jgi:membrane protease YdiL (CAAX protease family)
MTVSQDSITPAAGYDAPGPVDRVEVQGVDRPPWGAWATIGLSLVVGVVFVLLQVVVTVVVFAFNLLRDPGFDAEAFFAGLGSNGFLLAVMTTVTSLLTTGVIVLLVKMRDGPSLRDYLRLEPVGLRSALPWLAATLAMVAASDGLTLLLDRPLVPEFMLNIYQTAGFLPLFWLAIVVMAPVFEEVFFRGFMFAGLERSRLGGVGTIVLTALAWAAIHLQYDLYGIATIFVLGLLLGAVRLKTRSVLLTIGLHATINLIASLELVLLH